MTERINSILKYYNTNSSKFAEQIGVQKSSISHVLSGRNKPSLDFIQKLLRAFPEINADWLVLGKGKMIIGEEEKNLFNADEGSSAIKSREVEKKLSIEESEKLDLSMEDVVVSHLNKKAITNNSSRKTIKIVLFYSDDTYKEYFPEE